MQETFLTRNESIKILIQNTEQLEQVTTKNTDLMAQRLLLNRAG